MRRLALSYIFQIYVFNKRKLESPISFYTVCQCVAFIKVCAETPVPHRNVLGKGSNTLLYFLIIVNILYWYYKN